MGNYGYVILLKNKNLHTSAENTSNLKSQNPTVGSPPKLNTDQQKQIPIVGNKHLDFESPTLEFLLNSRG